DRNNQHKDWFALNLAQDSSVLLGRCYEQLGDADMAASAYRRVTSRDPRSANARLGVARMEWAAGRADAAADQYRQMVNLPNAPRAAWVELARVLLVQNLQKAQPDWSEVNEVLDRAGKLVPPPVEVALLRTEVLVAGKEYGQARQLLVQQHPDKQTRPARVWA